MTELYINNVLCDLGDSVIASTKQINNFFEVKDRQTSFTNTFFLPNTPKNRVIYDFFGVSGSLSEFPYRVHRADLVRDGIQTITNGKAVGVPYIVGKGLKVSLQSGNISFFDAISNKTLSELDFSSINHFLNNGKFIDAIDNQKDDGYVYPLADYGNTEATLNVDTISPAVFYGWFWDKIWEESGFEYEYIGEENPFEDVFFKDRVLFADRGIDRTFSNSVTQIELLLDFIGSNDSELNYIVPFQEVLDLDDIHSNVSSGSKSISVINPDKDSYYTFSIFLGNPNNNDIRFEILKNNRRVGVYTPPAPIELYLTTSDVITFRIVGTFQDLDISVSVFSKTQSNAVNFANYWNNIKQKDFIKHVFQDEGLIFNRIEGENKYQIITLNDLFQRLIDSVDMSDKFDDVLSVDANLSTLGKENYLRHKYEDESEFADGFFTLDNDTLREQANMFTSITYALEKSDVTYDGLRLERIPHFEVSDNGIKGKKSKLYSAIIDRSQVNLNYSINGTPSGYNESYPVARFNKLNYAYRVDGVFGVYKAIVNRFVKVVATIKLKPSDVYRFDFLKLRYFKQLGNYYYVNKIIGYKGDSTTKVELIKVDRSDVLGEFSNDFSEDFNI